MPSGANCIGILVVHTLRVSLPNVTFSFVSKFYRIAHMLRFGKMLFKSNLRYRYISPFSGDPEFENPSLQTKKLSQQD